MKVGPAIEMFRQYLVSEKRASAHTLRAYLHDVGELVAFACAGQSEAKARSLALTDLDLPTCRSYLASLHGRNDAVTIGRKLSSLRAFFRLAVRRRVIAGSPVAALRAPKRAKRLPTFLGKDDVGRLLDAAPDGSPEADPTQEAQARALFEVLYGAGLRVSEACNLDLGDIEADGQGGTVKVRQGKGRKDRLVPLAPRLLDELRAYGRLQRPRLWLFPG
ncbi:MAG TPA: tyrosine-type recombinase/integrase, partial [Polyangia bacterium]|nr:tyrosine-type recombinase/integrase [Polyangia bacterium]